MGFEPADFQSGALPTRPRSLSFLENKQTNKQLRETRACDRRGYLEIVLVPSTKLIANTIANATTPMSLKQRHNHATI